MAREVTDISQYNGTVNLATMKARAVDGVIARAGREGVDTRYHVNVAAAKAAGLDVGAYWRINPKWEPDGVTAGRMFADTIGTSGLTLPPMVDIETFSGLPGTNPVIQGEALRTWLRGFIAQIPGYKIAYTNQGAWDAMALGAAFGQELGLDCIVPTWPKGDAPKPPYTAADRVTLQNPDNWAPWAESLRSWPLPPSGFRKAGWQFAADDNGMGAWFGCQSVDLDLNIIDDAIYTEWKARMAGGTVATGESHNPALIKAWTTDYRNREVVRPRGIVLHTIVNSGNVSWQDFRSGAHGNDSTRAQYVDRDGTAVEIQPPDRKFICSWQGDEFVVGGVKYGHIPYETEDALGSEIGPYTAAQRESIIRALVEDCRMWGIPAVVPRVGDWTAAGIHYHSLHGLNTHHQSKPATDPMGFNYYSTEYGYWVRVVNPLTKTVGKTCPGAEKIAQHAGIVAEVARRLATGGGGQQPPTPTPTEDDDVYVDAKPDGVAIFHDGGGTVRWVTDGAEVAGKTVKSVGLAYFKQRVLVGAFPVGDGLRQWTGDEFMTVINGPVAGTAGPPGPPGADGAPGQDGVVTPGTVATVTFT